MSDLSVIETAEDQEVKSPQEGLRDLVSFLIETKRGQFGQRLDEEGRKDQIAEGLVALEKYFFGEAYQAGIGARQKQAESLADLDQTLACILPFLSGGGKLNIVKRPKEVMVGFVSHRYTSNGEDKLIVDLTSKLQTLSASLEQSGISSLKEGNYLKYSSKP